MSFFNIDENNISTDEPIKYIYTGISVNHRDIKDRTNDANLNSIKKQNLTYKTLEIQNEKTLLLLEINEMVDMLNSKLIDLNEILFISNYKLTSKNEIEVQNKIKSIKNNNKTIEDLMPLFIMYRSLFNL